MSDWIQSNWFELSTVILQLATLATLAWLGNKALAILASSRRHAESLRPQAEAPYREVAAMPRESSVAMHRAAEVAPLLQTEAPAPESAHAYHGGMRGLIPMDPPAASYSSRTAQVMPAAAHTSLLRSVVKWLNTPMNSNATVPWRRIRQVS